MGNSACVNYFILLWTLFIFFAPESEAGMGAGWKRNEEPESHAKKSIECYHCNSEYDPSCADPFNPYSLGTVNCSLRTKPEHLAANITATICRKTIQKVYGKTRVIRECGYITDPRDDKACFKRTGTHDVHIFYCSCTKSLCNRGGKLHVPFATLAAAFTLSLIIHTTNVYNLA